MKLRTLALITAALAAPALSAQEGPRFGVQAGVNLPLTDLKDAVDSKLGLNIGAHMTLDLRGGHMIRPRVDYTWFPEYTEHFGGDSLNAKISSLSLGADYLYFMGGKPEGVYFTGGVALVKWKQELSITIAGSTSSASDTDTGLSLAAGAGYRFNKSVGVELRYQKSKAWDANLDSIQAGVTFQF